MTTKGREPLLEVLRRGGLELGEQHLGQLDLAGADAARAKLADAAGQQLVERTADTHGEVHGRSVGRRRERDGRGRGRVLADGGGWLLRK